MVLAFEGAHGNQYIACRVTAQRTSKAQYDVVLTSRTGLGAGPGTAGYTVRAWVLAGTR